MTVASWEDFIAGKVPFVRPIAATIGVFDGVHRGHSVLIDSIQTQIRALDSAVFTFRENPKALTRPKSFEGNIFTIDQKIAVFRERKVDFVILIDFSGDFGKLSGKDFIGFLKDRGKLRYLAVGSDFRCGYRLDTDAEALKNMNERDGIPTDIVAPVMERGDPVSSSRIRTAIAAGNLVEAAALLGRNFVLDVRSVPITPGTDCVGYDARAMRRITPPDGRYPVVLTRDDSSPELSTDVSIRNGIVFVPAHAGAVIGVEFLPSVARSV